MSNTSTQSAQYAHVISALPVVPVFPMPDEPDSSWPVVTAVVIEIGKTGPRPVTEVYKIKYPGAADYYNPWFLSPVDRNWRKAPPGYHPDTWREGLKASAESAESAASAAPPLKSIRMWLGIPDRM